MMVQFYRAFRREDAGTTAVRHFHDGANVMYIIDAIVKSHQQQRWVRIER
jgi:hypothetical protein